MPPNILKRLNNQQKRRLDLQIEGNTTSNQMQEDSIMSIHGDESLAPPTPLSRSREKYTLVYTAKGLMRAKMKANQHQKRSWANLHAVRNDTNETRLGSPKMSEAVASRLGARERSRAITIPSRGGISRNFPPTINTSPDHSLGPQSIDGRFPGSTRESVRTGYKYNLSGRSIKACGAFGRSDSPASHSGMDPDLPRGKSSQLDFEFCATEEQLNSIQRNLTKLIALRQNRYKPTELQRHPIVKRSNRMNF